MSDLKPCPKCGPTAERPPHMLAENLAPAPWVSCGQCTFNASLDNWNDRAPDREALLAVARRACRATLDVVGECTFPLEPLDTTVERVVSEYLKEMEKP